MWGGPIQYRWMYPFERYIWYNLNCLIFKKIKFSYIEEIVEWFTFLNTLNNKVCNKGRVEGSICETYLIEETSTFGSYYFAPNVPSRRTRVPRNDNGGDSSHPQIFVFNYLGRAAGAMKIRWMDANEFEATKLYVLLNTLEVEPYIEYELKFKWVYL